MDQHSLDMATQAALEHLHMQHQHHMLAQQQQPQGNPQRAQTDEDCYHSEGDDNFKVVIRVRPPLPRELQGFTEYQCTSMVDARSGQLITISENLPAVLSGQGASDGMLYATYRFTFDHVYDQDSTQQEVYDQTAKPLVLSTLQGYNAAIIAYGQTGTGKTYTMEGELEGPLRGIIPRSVEDIFAAIENDPEPSATKYLVRASYLQIYNEVISDLLKPDKVNLMIREDRRRGVFVDGLSEWVVRSPAEVYGLMMRGAQQRATGATKMNEVSSRSHAVCIIIVEKCTTILNSSNNTDATAAAAAAAMACDNMGLLMAGGGPSSRKAVAAAAALSGKVQHTIKVGKLNLVDLAGSERVHITGATGKRLEESKKINASLSALGNVIAALTDRKERAHIPYRDSKLTRILEDSLGGNCKTTMMCMISPAMEAFAESLSTLKFANRAKNIKNQAVVNEDADQRTLLRKYERELRKLRAELTRRNKELVDKRHLLEVEEQKRRAEADKLAALTALENASAEFMREKQEKKELEAKIAAMQSQLLIGGNKLEDIPAFRTLLAREHKRIRGEYEARLRELEAERHMVEEDLAQVDRYKQLLLKQRDIMIALTARLNERDEQIMTLQEELEAYDRHQRLLEDNLDSKTAEIIQLRRAALEAAAVHMQQAPHGDGSAGLMHQVKELQLANTELQQQLHQQSRATGGRPLLTARSSAGGNMAVAAAAAAASNNLALVQQLQEQQKQAEQAVEEKSSELASMQVQLDFANKEKAALQTILEGKVLPLAEEVAKGLTVLQSEAVNGSASGVGMTDRMAQQVTTLQRLLTATVAAMARASSNSKAAQQSQQQQQQSSVAAASR